MARELVKKDGNSRLESGSSVHAEFESPGISMALLSRLVPGVSFFTVVGYIAFCRSFKICTVSLSNLDAGEAIVTVCHNIPCRREGVGRPPRTTVVRIRSRMRCTQGRIFEFTPSTH